MDVLPGIWIDSDGEFSVFVWQKLSKSSSMQLVAGNAFPGNTLLMTAPRRGMTGIVLIGGAGEGGGGEGGGEGGDGGEGGGGDGGGDGGGEGGDGGEGGGGQGGGGDGGGDGGGGGEGGGGEGGGGDGERNCEKMRTSARLRTRLPVCTIVTYQPVMP